MDIISIREHQEFAEKAAIWFHEKWHIPKSAYQESINACLKGNNPVPQWYLAIEEGDIIGGMGVIENDFHERTDLTPNVCAVYVEKTFRCSGIAGKLLNFVCEDMKKSGISTLYLITDHTSFYERYGWEYLCIVKEQGNQESKTRMYVHHQ